jgi:hypothetical protein
MSTNTVFQKCGDSVISQIREQWPRHETRLGELLGAERPEDVQLDLRVDCDEKANRYDVRAILVMPSATLTAEALDENVASALDRVAELLAHSVQQHRGGAELTPSVGDEVETASADSFPASDPPSWTHVSVSGQS